MPKKTVPVVYLGPADKYITPAPSGAVYTFLKGEITEIEARDASFFLVEPVNALSYDEPAAPEPPSLEGDFAAPSPATEDISAAGHDFDAANPE